MSTGNPLVPCPSCARHVRALDANCPFCNGALPTNLASRAVPAASQRLGRGAAFVFASSLAMQACASSNGGGGDAATQDSAPSDSAGDTVTTEDMGGPVAAYGAPADVVIPDASSSDASAPVDAGGPDDSGGNVAAYGLPAPVDAGSDASDDAGDGGGGARYGAPPARNYEEWI